MMASPESMTRVATPRERLDLASVKASQALSGELVLELLIERLMVTAVELAGADNGLLILHGDEPRVEAEAIVDHERVTIRLRPGGTGPAGLPESMLPSALCLPLSNQGSLKGVLYLESSLGRCVFTPARREALGVLASQAAISLENARVYADLKQAHGRTRQAEQDARRILDGIPALIYTASPDGRVNYFNRRWLEYTGRPLEEELGLGWMSGVHPDDRDRVLAQRRGLVPGGEGSAIEARLRGADGAYRCFIGNLVPLRDAAGQIAGCCGIAIDIDDRKRAEHSLRKAFEETRALRDRLHQENVALREEVDKASMFEDIVGNSPPLRAVLSRVSKVAPTDSTALITGETGTGKELIARAIHRRSPRSSRPFVAVNCAAIPKDLIASELFGHEKGAFTGALQRRVGRFELAQGGTLFLDEVGEIPLDTQVGLLRVLQERRFERVGGTQSVEIDVRVISATNRDLEAAMNAGFFRRDLFYRLNVFPIQVPSLRERREDIPMLVKYFIDRFATKAGKRFSRIDKKSLNLLQSYDWPGNIRELQNVIERSVILCETKEFAVDEHWLARGRVATEPKKRRLDEHMVGEEKKMIEAALAETGGKVAGPSGAAVTLGMPATTLYSKIKSMKIDKRRFKRS